MKFVTLVQINTEWSGCDLIFINFILQLGIIQKLRDAKFLRFPPLVVTEFVRQNRHQILLSPALSSVT